MSQPIPSGGVFKAADLADSATMKDRSFSVSEGLDRPDIRLVIERRNGYVYFSVGENAGPTALDPVELSATDHIAGSAIKGGETALRKVLRSELLETLSSFVPELKVAMPDPAPINIYNDDPAARKLLAQLEQLPPGTNLVWDGHALEEISD